MAETAVPRAQRPYLRAGDVARRLHVSPKTISRWATEGKIPYVRTIGHHRRFDPDFIDGLVERLGRTDVDLEAAN